MDVLVCDSLIEEWDMRAAGPSVAAELGFISESTFYDLLEYDKLKRNIMFGVIAKETGSDFMQKISDSIKDFMKRFILDNNIKKDDVIEIAKDAIFIKNPSINRYIQGDYVRFINKGSYTFLLRFPSKEGSTAYINIYKEKDGIKVRGSKINESHKGYDALIKIIDAYIDKNSRSWNKAFLLLKKSFNSDSNRLIEHCENDHLLSVILDFMSI